MSKRNRSTSFSFVPSLIGHCWLAFFAISLAPNLLHAQPATTSPEVQALREEVNELKTRLAGLESKLEAFALATPPAARGVTAPAPAAPAIDQASSKSVPAA